MVFRGKNESIVVTSVFNVTSHGRLFTALLNVTSHGRALECTGKLHFKVLFNVGF